MYQVYAIHKQTNLLTYVAASLALIKARLKELGENEEDFYILQDVDMKYISRIVYVDSECIYNNKEFWTILAPTLLDEYAEHEVKDVLGQTVDYFRFVTELNSNASRISAIDGIAGEIEYNMTVGNELISLLREECVKTDLKEITPLQIAAKTAQIIPMLQTGSFREAAAMIDTLELDEFFTEALVTKYKEMLAAADVISYAS